MLYRFIAFLALFGSLSSLSVLARDLREHPKQDVQRVKAASRPSLRENWARRAPNLQRLRKLYQSRSQSLREAGPGEGDFAPAGIVAGTASLRAPDSPPIAGEQFILMVNDHQDPDTKIIDNSLLITGAISSLKDGDHPDVFFLTEAEPRRQINAASGRPIAVDLYGQDIFFIDRSTNAQDENLFDLWAVYPDGTGEERLTDSGDWWSVAVSPSGRYLSLTSSFEENKIHIFDLSKDPAVITEFPLLHPENTDGSKTSDIVKYADAMTFLDDNNLAYDNFNVDGSREFWDVNLLDITTGIITPLLAPQADGIDVYNPTFASTNPSVLSVELFEKDVQSLVTGVNLETGTTHSIFDNGKFLASADYSTDDSLMVFQRLHSSGAFDIWAIPLKADKITAEGDPFSIIIEAQLATWFVIGTPPTATVGFQASFSKGEEGVADVRIPVRLSAPAAQDVTVRYAVTGGTATGSGVDYTRASGLLTIPKGQSVRRIFISVVDDPFVEPNENIKITLSHPTGAWLGDKITHTYTIVNNDLGLTHIAPSDWMLYE